MTQERIKYGRIRRTNGGYTVLAFRLHKSDLVGEAREMIYKKQCKTDAEYDKAIQAIMKKWPNAERMKQH